MVITPEPEVQTPIHAVTLPESALTDGTALQQVEAAGGNAALFDMKTDEGALAFTSAQPLAVETGVNAPEDRNAAIQALNAQEGLYTVARVSCFRDNTVPRTHPELALRSAIGNWRDDGYRWFSPAYPEVRSYVTGVCLELAGLGFDEILLDWACYPVSGDLSTILTGEAYDPATLSQTLTEFYTQLRADLEAAYPGVKLSAVLPADLEQESAGGQTPALAELLDRVWVWTDAQARPALATLLSQHGLEDPDSQLVLLGAAGQGDQSWALWPAG